MTKYFLNVEYRKNIQYSLKSLIILIGGRIKVAELQSCSWTTAELHSCSCAPAGPHQGGGWGEAAGGRGQAAASPAQPQVLNPELGRSCLQPQAQAAAAGQLRRVSVLPHTDREAAPSPG